MLSHPEADNTAAPMAWLTTKLMALTVDLLRDPERSSAQVDFRDVVAALGCFNIHDHQTFRNALLPLVILDPQQPWCVRLPASSDLAWLSRLEPMRPLARLICRDDVMKLETAWRTQVQSNRAADLDMASVY
jgi:hypothetical protein